MRSTIAFAVLLLSAATTLPAAPSAAPAAPAASPAEVRNADRPARGEWSFSPRQIWSVDQAGGQPLQRPAELRVLADGTSVFHDFDAAVSHVFAPDGKHVAAFAARGDQPGQVSRYLNCFVAGDEIVVGTPSDLHFFARDGAFRGSQPNNLFARFPLVFLGGRTALLAPGSLAGLAGGVARIVRVDFASGEESAFAELTVAGPGGGAGGTGGAGGAAGGAPRGPMIMVRGLTPAVEAAYDRDLGRVYYGCTTDYAIHAATADGASLGAFRLERPRQPVDEAAKREHCADVGLPAEHVAAIVAALPDEFASFRQMWAGGGMVYVLPPAGLAREVAAQPIDIFAADGRYLHRAELRLPGDLRFSPDGVALVGSDLYALCVDGEGRWSLRRFAVAVPEVKN